MSQQQSTVDSLSWGQKGTELRKWAKKQPGGLSKYVHRLILKDMAERGALPDDLAELLQMVQQVADHRQPREVPARRREPVAAPEEIRQQHEPTKKKGDVLLDGLVL